MKMGKNELESATATVDNADEKLLNDDIVSDGSNPLAALGRVMQQGNENAGEKVDDADDDLDDADDDLDDDLSDGMDLD